MISRCFSMKSGIRRSLSSVKPSFSASAWKALWIPDSQSIRVP